MKVDDINDKPPHHIETFTEGEGGGEQSGLADFSPVPFKGAG